MAARLPDTGARDRDLAAGRALLRTGSRSFHLASLLLPREIRNASTSLYAFCRLADDAIDMPADAAEGLAPLRSQLDRVYDGTPLPQSVERLLAQTVARYRVPRELLDALLEGFEWDLLGRQYDTAGELTAYAARVAGSVGVVMTLLMGVRESAVLARACDLGIAMQLTNIARDVGQDAHAGRLYLPRNWLREAGIDPQTWLARPVFNAGLAGVIERLLVMADALYFRSVAGIAGLPARVRPGIHAARLLYAQIGNDLRLHGLDALARRAHVGTGRKLGLLLTAVAAAARAPAARHDPPLEEAQFLLNAVQSSRPLAERVPGAVTAGVRAPEQSRAEWLLELFERLQRQDQAGTAAPLRFSGLEPAG